MCITELKQMNAMNVYQSVESTSVPRSNAIYNSMFNLKRKRDATTGEIIEYKARLVFLGNHIRQSDVPEDCYAPTASHKALMLQQSISAGMGYVNAGYDVTGAFLYALLEEPLYMQLPKEWEWETRYGSSREHCMDCRRYQEDFMNTLLRNV